MPAKKGPTRAKRTAKVAQTSLRSDNRDVRVDAFIEALPGWQQALCREVRELVHRADPEITETIKRGRLPFFTRMIAQIATNNRAGGWRKLKG